MKQINQFNINVAKIFFLLFLLSFAYKIGFSQSSLKVERYSRLTLDSVSIMLLDTNSLKGYLTELNAAISMKNDSSFDSNSDKGELLLSRLATSFELQLKNGFYSVENDEVRDILNIFKENQYVFYQPPTSKLNKLVFNLRKGNYRYIYNRLSNENYFKPLLIIFISFSILGILVLLKVIRFHYSFYINILFISFCGIVLLGLLILRFLG